MDFMTGRMWRREGERAAQGDFSALTWESLTRGCVRGHLRNHLFPQHGQFGAQMGASLLWPLGGGPESMGTWTPSSQLQLPQPGSGSCP